MTIEEVLERRAYEFESQLDQQPMPNPNPRCLTEQEKEALLAFQEWAQKQ